MMESSFKKVIVTGATSFLGSSFVSRLVKEDVYVYAVVRDEEKARKKLGDNPRIKYVVVDLARLNSIRNDIQNADWFVHFAWDGSGNVGRANEEVQNRNVDYSFDALKIAIDLGCKKFLFPGSQAEYGSCYSTIREEQECNPKSSYGKAKLEFSKKAEELCAQHSCVFIHTRIFSVYGYGDRSGTLVDLCVKGFNGASEIKLGPCTQKWNYLYIDDFCEIILRLLMNVESTQVINVAGSDTRCLREYIDDIYELSNKSGTCEYGQVASNPEGSPQLIPDIQRMLHYSEMKAFKDFKSGIREVMEKEGLI